MEGDPATASASQPGGNTTTDNPYTPPTALAFVANPDVPAVVVSGHGVAARYQASGGTLPYSFTYAQPEPGLSWNASGTTATLSGLPTAAGANGGSSVTVTDSSIPPQSATLGTNPFDLVVPTAGGLTVSTQASFPTSLLLGKSATAIYGVTGGQPPYTWSSGATAPGLTGLDSGYTYYIQGSPTQAGTIAPVTLTVVDSSPSPLSGTIQSNSFQVVTPPARPLTVTMSNTFGNVATGTPVTGTLSYVDGTAPYVVSVSPLDDGFATTTSDANDTVLGSAGVAAGHYPAMKATVTDSSSPPRVGSYVTQAFDVNDPGVPAITITATSEPASPFTLDPYGRNDTTTGIYTFSGGTEPYTITTSTLTGEMQTTNNYQYLCVQTGLDCTQYPMFKTFYVAYSPKAPETMPAVTLTVTDVNGVTASFVQSPVLVLAGGDATPLAIQANPDLPSSVQQYAEATANLQVSGGTSPYSVTTVGTLAPGFSAPSISGSYVVLDGYPTLLGPNPTMTIEVTDAAGTKADYAVSPFDVLPPPPISFSPNPDLPSTPVAIGDRINASISVSGGVPPYVAMTGTPDPGLTVTPTSNGTYGGYFTIAGSPTTAGANPGLSLSVTDSIGTTQSFVTSGFTAVQYGDATHVAILANPDLSATANVGDTLSGSYEMFGGTPPYVVKFSGMPTGFSAAPEGALSNRQDGFFDVWDITGTPVSAGNYGPITITATDSAGHVGSLSTTSIAVSPQDTSQTSQLQVYGNLYVGGSYISPYLTQSVPLDGVYQGDYVASGGVGKAVVTLVGTAPGLVATTDPSSGTLNFSGGAAQPGQVTGLSAHAVDAVGNVADVAIAPFTVADTAAGTALAFTQVGNQGDMSIGDTGSAAFAVSGGRGYFTGATPFIHYAVTGAPAGMAMTAADANEASTLAGQPRDVGTYSPTVTVTDGFTSATYSMPAFKVTTTVSGLCIVTPFTYGTLPAGVESDPTLMAEYAQVGCGKGPYTAVGRSTTSGSYLLGQSPCSAGGTACDGVITLAGTVDGLHVTVYDSDGDQIALPSVSVTDAPSPWDPSYVTCLWDQETQMCHAP